MWCGSPRKGGEVNTLRRALTPPENVRYYWRFRQTRKGFHEGETDVPTQHAAPLAHAWFPGADEHQKRSARAETPPREGPKAADGQRRIAIGVPAPTPP